MKRVPTNEGSVRMIFITLSKWRRKPTKEMIAQFGKLHEQAVKEGVKFIGRYSTLGRYDAVSITEAPDEKTVMKALLRFGDLVSSETLVAVTGEEAIKLID